MTYLILETVVPAGVCRLTTIQNVPRDERLKIGEPCAEGFPEEALFKMSDDFPKDVRVADSSKNNSSLLVVSDRFRVALESVAGALLHNEVLPVKIVNHKGRAEKGHYFVVNQLDHPACVDETQSKGRRFSLNPAKFQFLEKMVLDAKQIANDRMLFRPAQYPRYPLVRSDLAESLGKLELTGVRFREIAGFQF